MGPDSLNEAEVDRFVAMVKGLDEVDAIAAVLRAHGLSFGESARIFAESHDVVAEQARKELRATDTWQAATRRYRIEGAPEVEGDRLNSVNGRIYDVGAEVLLPGGTYRVIDVRAGDENTDATLVVEAVPTH
jgi:hypothetical protein